MFVHLREMRNYLDIFDYTCARSFFAFAYNLLLFVNAL